MSDLEDVDAVNLWLRTLKDKGCKLSERREAASKLGMSRDSRAIEALQESTQDVDDLNLAIDCYSALEQMQNLPVLDIKADSLVNKLAQQIDTLFNHTKVIGTREVGTYTREEWEEWNQGPGDTHPPYSGVEIVDVTAPDPDIDGIRSLVALMPDSLRDRVKLKVTSNARQYL